MKMTTAAAFYLMVSFLLPIAPTQAVQQYEVICLNDIQGASEPYPLAINNHGEIVGSDYAQYPSDTFLITPHFEYIKLTSNDQAHASAINNQGIIAGRYEQNAAILDPTGNDNHVQICTIPSSIQDINENNIAVGTIRRNSTKPKRRCNLYK